MNKVILPSMAIVLALPLRALPVPRLRLYPSSWGIEPRPLRKLQGDTLQEFSNLFRMFNVSALRRDRINSDEEERFRLGFEIKTGVRFAERGGERSVLYAQLFDASGSELATLAVRPCSNPLAHEPRMAEAAEECPQASCSILSAAVGRGVRTAQMPMRHLT